MVTGFVLKRQVKYRYLRGAWGKNLTYYQRKNGSAGIPSRKIMKGSVRGLNVHNGVKFFLLSGNLPAFLILNEYDFIMAGTCLYVRIY